MNKIKFLKTIDSIIGRGFAGLLPVSSEKTAGAATSPSRALIIRPGGIGDAVLLIPMIEELKKAYPGLKTDILCEKRNAGVFSIYTGMNRVYLYDKISDLIECFKNSYNIIIDTEQWHRLPAALAYFIGADIKAGFSTNEREKFFTHKVAYSHENYEAESFLTLLAAITGKSYEFPVNSPFLDAPEHPESHKLGNYICIFPGASVKERRWGGTNYGLTAKALTEMGFNAVILGGTAETEDAGIILRHCPQAANYCGTTTLRESAMLLKGAKALITADSGLLHVAVALNIPTVSLFGSGIEKKWGPKGKNHTIINKNLPCSPCTKFGYTPSCKYNQTCIRQITVDEVLINCRKVYLS
ncbi:MAG: glycosyltransferase family 9 protein [Nitrospirae bacterium YQR-1]